MNDNMNLIVMLTCNDKTVDNAYEIFDECKNSKAKYWGFKEKPLPIDKMKQLFNYMKSCGKKTVLEVVAYSEEEGLNGARIAVECGCNILMGTTYYDSINNYCKKHNLIYMPFAGKVSERPSILEGNIDEIINEANNILTKGVNGFDLLGYRYVEDAVKLNQAFVSSIKANVCIAGSINSYQRLDELKAIKPWAFTIGKAFFDHQFGDSFSEQINNVCDYINK